MSATSRGSWPVLKFARSVLKVARRRWPERESGIATAQELKFGPFALRIAPAEQESARNCSSQVQRSNVRCRRHRLDHRQYSNLLDRCWD